MVDINEIQKKLYEKLKPSGWADKLKGFLLSEDFTRILETLLKESEEGKKVTPLIKNLLRAFEECPYDKLKVVMLCQDPYPQQTFADGIAFSCTGTEVPASLRYMFKEIEETVYPGTSYEWNSDLARWSNQGVLMLNIALTTTVNQSGKHFALWQPFIAYVLDILAFNNTELVYVFVGKMAQRWKSSISSNNFKLECNHPASAYYNASEKWDSGDIFNKINKTLEKHNTKIIW